MEYIGIVHFMDFIGVVVMGYLGWGDGLAPYIGKKYGTREYQLLGREKSIEGSIGVFVAGLVGVLLLHLLVFYRLPRMNEFLWILLFGVVAIIVEAVSPSDVDNFLIPAAILIISYLI